MATAHGSFTVTINAQPADESPQGAPVHRALLDKVFKGDLMAVSRGLMLSSMGQIKGSAGYVAMEFVSGTLQGRAGNFALQHFGLMTHGAPELRVVVVPDSGTDELVGLTGSLNVDISGGEHRYTFEYSLP